MVPAARLQDHRGTGHRFEGTAVFLEVAADPPIEPIDLVFDPTRTRAIDKGAASAHALRAGRDRHAIAVVAAARVVLDDVSDFARDPLDAFATRRIPRIPFAAPELPVSSLALLARGAGVGVTAKNGREPSDAAVVEAAETRLAIACCVALAIRIGKTDLCVAVVALRTAGHASARVSERTIVSPHGVRQSQQVTTVFRSEAAGRNRRFADEPIQRGVSLGENLARRGPGVGQSNENSEK